MIDVNTVIDAAHEVVRQADNARYNTYDHAQMAACVAVAAAFATFATEIEKGMEDA